MPYIGNAPATQFASLDYQDLTGVTGSPAKRGFTLDHAVGSANEIEVFVNNVRQEPSVAYTVSGTTLTMTGDVETTDDFYVVFQGKAIASVLPTDGSVTSAKLVYPLTTFSSTGIDDNASSTAITLDSSGNCGLGETSPSSALHVKGGAGANVAIQSTAGSHWRIGDGVGSSNGTLVFRDHTNSTNRMVINSSGRVKINTESTVSTATAEQFAVDAGTAGGHGGVFASDTTGGYSCIYVKSGTNISNLISFYRTTSLVGSITTNGSTTSYNTSSDYRLKENVTEITGATDRLKQLNPVRFNFIADADTTVDGFLAHEVQDIVPEATTGTKDEVDNDGNPVFQGIDQSKLVPLLVATIQELEARIAALEAN